MLTKIREKLKVKRGLLLKFLSIFKDRLKSLTISLHGQRGSC